MLDPPSVDKNDEENFYDLVLAAPDEDKVLKTMAESLIASPSEPQQLRWRTYPNGSKSNQRQHNNKNRNISERVMLMALQVLRPASGRIQKNAAARGFQMQRREKRQRFGKGIQCQGLVARDGR